MAAPTVTTQAVDEVGATVAQGNGTVTADGGKTISARGVCVDSSANPDLTKTVFTTTGTTGAFTVAMSALTVTHGYHARAYATNADGTSYGADVQFTTGTPTAKKLLYALGVI